MNRLRLVSFLLLCSVLACTNPTSATEIGASDKRFFDLSEYFNQQAELLADRSVVEKSASINGNKETQTINAPNFREELQLFIDSDINRTSWLDKYAVDSTTNAAGGLTGLAYTALEDKLRTRRVAISFAQTEVTQIEIVNATDNVIAQTKQELSYAPQRGYAIKSFQDILFAAPRTMEVQVNF